MVLVLLLFDIDGTLLLRASTEHAQALRDALECVYGVRRAIASTPRAAPTRRSHATSPRSPGSMAAIRAGLDELIALLAASAMRATVRRRSRTRRPGMVELLDALASATASACSLVTGNYEPVARLKLERAGIGHHFAGRPGRLRLGRRDRPRFRRSPRGAPAGIPARAARWCRRHAADIACARADGVRVLAVATGLYPAAELAGADAVVADGFGLAELLGCELRCRD